MTILSNFPLVSQLTTVTGDGKPSENAAFDCVAASIDAVCRYLLGKPENSIFNPDAFKDAAYGDAYKGGTAAVEYVDFCKSIGIHLYSVQAFDAANAVQLTRRCIQDGKPVIYTELDPYVDTRLPQYASWTHVCVWFGEDDLGLTAMDPYIGKPLYKTDAAWQDVLRSNELWLAERIPTMTVPANWHDDGHTLTAPNGIKVVLGFREYVLNHNWDSGNIPLGEEFGTTQLEDSNPSLGGGTQQIFRWSMLGYTKDKGVFFEWIGQELVKARQQVASLYALVQQLKQAQQPQGIDPAKVKNFQTAAGLQAHQLVQAGQALEQLLTSTQL